MNKECYRCNKRFNNTNQYMILLNNGIRYRCYGRCDQELMRLKRLRFEEECLKKRLRFEEEKYQQRFLERQKEQKKIDAIKKCKCCFGDFDIVNLYSCSKITAENKHKVCESCLIMYLKFNLNNGACSLDCMFERSDTCHGTYNLETIYAFLNEKEYEIYKDNYEIYEIQKLSNLIDNYQICPNCEKYGSIVSKSQLTMKYRVWINCSKCQLQWCSYCLKKRIFYNGSDCHCYRIEYDKNVIARETEAELLKKIEYIENIICNTINELIIHKCPYCNVSYIKEYGCNLITCNTCRGKSCYLCNEKILQPRENSYYWHFKNHALNDDINACPLFNYTENLDDENTVYVKNKIQLKLNDFQDSNNKYINTLLYYILKYNTNSIINLCDFLNNIKIDNKLKKESYITYHKKKHPLAYIYLKKHNKLKNRRFIRA